MPHVNSRGGDDLATSDEVKVYNYEGDDEKKTSENSLSEDKLEIITESEEDKHHGLSGENYSGNEKPGDGRTEDVKNVLPPHPAERGLPPGFMLPAYYPNGASLGGKFPMAPYPYPMVYAGGNDFTSPPPAHMGIPSVTIDPKTGVPRGPMYPIPPPSQFPPHLYSPDFSQQWQRSPGGYPISSSALGYPSPLLSSTRFGPHGLLPHHPGLLRHDLDHMSHAAIITPGPRQDILDRHQMHDGHIYMNQANSTPPPPENKKKPPHIKKPLNAFMLFMKEKRSSVVAECTLKESAAINQILGRRWHALDRSEQAKYYEMARKEKELHMQLYPNWSARDNYAITSAKKKKRKRSDGPPSSENKTMIGPDGEQYSMATGECTTPKKCRARYGLDQQRQWCKPCRMQSTTEMCELLTLGNTGHMSRDHTSGGFIKLEQSAVNVKLEQT